MSLRSISLLRFAIRFAISISICLAFQLPQHGQPVGVPRHVVAAPFDDLPAVQPAQRFLRVLPRRHRHHDRCQPVGRPQGPVSSHSPRHTPWHPRLVRAWNQRRGREGGREGGRERTNTQRQQRRRQQQRRRRRPESCATAGAGWECGRRRCFLLVGAWLFLLCFWCESSLCHCWILSVVCCCGCGCWWWCVCGARVFCCYLHPPPGGRST